MKIVANFVPSENRNKAEFIFPAKMKRFSPVENARYEIFISAEAPYIDAMTKTELVKYHNPIINHIYENLTLDQRLGIEMAFYALFGPESKFALITNITLGMANINYTHDLANSKIILLSSDTPGLNVSKIGMRRPEDPRVDNWIVDIKEKGGDITLPYTMRVVNDAGKEYIIQFGDPGFLAQLVSIYQLMGLDYHSYLLDLHYNGVLRDIDKLLY